MIKRRNILSFVLIAMMVLVLGGCSAKSVSAYSLPLGDSGIISELDFKTKDSYAYSYNDEGVVKEWVSYDYVEDNKDYQVTIEFGKTDVAKTTILKVGYYNDNNEFVEYSTSNYIVLKSDDFATATISFKKTEAKDTVVKLVFGTNVDEARIKSENPDIKNSALRKELKKYRGSSFVVRSLTLSDGVKEYNILSKPITDKNGELTGARVGVVSTDLTYYNTAQVTFDNTSDSLALALNYKGGPWQWIVKIIGEFLNWITRLVGGYYWLGLMILTFIIRTLAWPIYAKSNSMTSKMSEIQPEIDKINKKYEGKNDQNSQMKKQMETKALMKKNHVSMWGCLLPFLQMPIFLWVYQVVQRFPITPLYTQGIKFNFLWTTFGTNYGQTTGDWILALIVGATMILSQELTNILSKKINKQRENFYTQNKKTQSNNSMRIMMIVMTVMMVYFAWRSAGIAFYWIIGNTYQIAQTTISKILEAKRLEKKQRESGRPRGRN
ncbi:MAG: YidC/Oxa1 family membrane protein insertase [Gammaproteobacteria bacterium]|nr:YidC/Oxa1 family membrane protein insertase [Gammaproteobacteria bacterium]